LENVIFPFLLLQPSAAISNAELQYWDLLHLKSSYS
jgi:hypothetical protein